MFTKMIEIRIESGEPHRGLTPATVCNERLHLFPKGAVHDTKRVEREFC